MTTDSQTRSTVALFELAEVTERLSSHIGRLQQQLSEQTAEISRLKAQGAVQDCVIQALLGTSPALPAVADRYQECRQRAGERMHHLDMEDVQAAFEPFAQMFSELMAPAAPPADTAGGAPASLSTSALA